MGMQLKVLASGSSGNCYLLDSGNECLVIEAGIPFLNVKRALDFNVRKIVGVVAGHVHSDHSKYAREYERAGIPVLKPYEIEHYAKRFYFGGFTIMPFPLIHDVPCFGFYITEPKLGALVYASDTEYIKYQFPGVNHIIVEANYSMEYVDRDEPNYEHRLRGHMSIDTACGFLKANNNPGLKTVVLAHLSPVSSDPIEFSEQAQKMVSCPVYVAEKGLRVELAKPC